MKEYTALDLYNVLNELSDEELFKFMENKNIYSDVEMKHLAKSLDVMHPKYNNEKLQREIVFDFINRLLRKNKEFYDPGELIDVVINKKQFNKAIDDISANSIYFKNEADHWILFFDTENVNTVHNKKYYFNTIKAILELYCIHLQKKEIEKSDGILTHVYVLSVDKNIKKIADQSHNE